jgi:hypothetical protein
MRGNSQTSCDVLQATFHLRIVGSKDPSHSLRTAAQLEALRRLLHGGEAR